LLTTKDRGLVAAPQCESRRCCPAAVDGKGSEDEAGLACKDPQCRGSDEASNETGKYARLPDNSVRAAVKEDPEIRRGSAAGVLFVESFCFRSIGSEKNISPAAERF